ncbi:type II secretory pathway component PulM [Pseudomonas sp. R151218B TE3479]
MTVATRPLSVRVNDSATAAGLDMAEMEVDGDSLRLAVSGDASALLHWLDQQEREGAVLRSLTLEVENGVLGARVVLRQ